MIDITLVKRYEKGVIESSLQVFRSSLKGVKGIRPELCPAIRSYHSLGWRLSSPVDIIFRNERSFDVDNYLDEFDRKFLVPGVIGDKESKKLYARIDSGFSLLNLSVPLMAIKCQGEDPYLSKFEIAPVIYPEGYTGPILLAVSANEDFKLNSNHLIVQIIPLASAKVNLSIRVDCEYIEENFEGLFKNNWDHLYKKQGRLDSEDILNQ